MLAVGLLQQWSTTRRANDCACQKEICVFVVRFQEGSKFSPVEVSLTSDYFLMTDGPPRHCDNCKLQGVLISLVAVVAFAVAEWPVATVSARE